MIKKANVRYTVTADMIQPKFTPKVCSRVPRNALHESNIWFRKLRRKPTLTDEDVKERSKWARTYRNKPRSWWRNHIQVHIDNHAVKVPTNGKARDLLAARHVHGSYRDGADALRKEHVGFSHLLLCTGRVSPPLQTMRDVGGALRCLSVRESHWCGECWSRPPFYTNV